MASTNLFMLSQVAKHKSKNDCWLVIDGQVLNVTRFLEEHHGGDVVILEVAGKDVTKEFQAAGHSKAAWNLLLKYHVTLPCNNIQGNQVADERCHGQDDLTQKYAPFLELFVPLLVAGSYFCYRFITAVN